MLAGTDLWHTAAVPRAGLPALRCSDGPNGVRGTSFAAPPSALFPCGAALGASWDPALVGEVGAALAQEAHAKSVHLLLAPTVNLHRSPRGGRHFECFSEDPELTARPGRRLHHRGPVHWGCGLHQALHRQRARVRTHHDRGAHDERTLREVYLRPFEAAHADAGVRTVMAAYNYVNGITHATEPPPDRLLREDWGFDGLVMSDWVATHSTAPPCAPGSTSRCPGRRASGASASWRPCGPARPTPTTSPAPPTGSWASCAGAGCRAPSRARTSAPARTPPRRRCCAARPPPGRCC